METAARERLAAVARAAVRAALEGRATAAQADDDPALQERAGAFVTLRTQGRLRGCIGRFEADLPVGRAVEEMAVAAATSDPRFVFDRILPEELDDLEIEISVLSPLRRIDDPLDFTLGTHGIYIRRGMQQGCFLPQVAEETGWSKEEFLTHCARDKAGLSADAWREAETEVYVFTADAFSA